MRTLGLISGVFVVFGMMILALLLAGGFGFWEYNLNALPSLGLGFWLWSFAAWIVSNYFGGMVASSVGRVKSVGDGMLTGFVVWASASVVMAAFYIAVSGVLLPPMPSDVMLWGAFTSDVLAMTAGFRGGANGTLMRLTGKMHPANVH